MGYYLTEHQMAPAPESRPATRPSSLGANNPIGAPFGKAILSSKYWDSDTKTIAFQLRDYGPGIARWLSRDPIGDEAFLRMRLAEVRNRVELDRLLDAQLAPPYVFVVNDPKNHVDAEGLAACAMTSKSDEKDYGTWFPINSPKPEYLSHTCPAGKQVFCRVIFSDTGKKMLPYIYAVCWCAKCEGDCKVCESCMKWTSVDVRHADPDNPYGIDSRIERDSCSCQRTPLLIIQ